MTYIPYLGTFFFSRYPSVALARNQINLPLNQDGTSDTLGMVINGAALRVDWR